MSNPASPIRPDQLLQDADHRLVTEAQITQWNAGGGGTILEMITPIILIEQLAYAGRPDDTWAHDTWVQFSYPVGIPSYASSLILNCWLEVQSNDSAKMYMRATNLPQITALWAYGEGTVGNFIEIPYHSSRQFEAMISGDTTPGFLIEVVGYRRSTVIDALALSNTNPLADGTASPGSSLYVSRADHIHPDKSSSNEHVRLGGNLIMQWGSLTNILLEQSTWYSVTFPYPLDAAPYNIDSQLVFNSSMNGTISLKVRNITNLGFEIGGEHSEDSYYGDIMWKAIGPKAV